MTRKGSVPAQIRTFALVGHRSSGKTSLGDVLIKTTGVTRATGRVDNGTSLLDHEPEEKRRQLTLGPAFIWMNHGDHLLNLVDTPGSTDVAHERSLAVQACDGAVVLVSAADGVEVGTEKALIELDDAKLPRIAVVSKMDRQHNLEQLLDGLNEATTSRVVQMEIPFYEDGRFVGVISLLDQKAYRYDEKGRYSPEPIPERYWADVSIGWERVMEAVALTDDDLLEQYLE
ncbi:MAG: GTP-binding protein, partial [Proteobacteria bacterium]|nr:GTP-binding protein [Pseudomonadota bacterium]